MNSTPKSFKLSALALVIVVIALAHQTFDHLILIQPQTALTVPAIDNSVWSEASAADSDFIRDSSSDVSRASILKLLPLSKSLTLEDVDPRSFPLFSRQKEYESESSRDGSDSLEWVHRLLLDGRKSRKHHKTFSRDETDLQIPAGPTKIYVDPEHADEIRVGEWKVVESHPFIPRPVSKKARKVKCSAGSFCSLISHLDSVHLPGSRSPMSPGWRPNEAAAEVAQDQIRRRLDSEDARRRRAALTHPKQAGGAAAGTPAALTTRLPSPFGSQASTCSLCLSKALAQAGAARWLTGRWVEREARKGACAALCPA
mmetsp:Transcript_77387/g.208847  ORF Transcript_77387/g.208847 Transcript_77387/m.208847 type:complete len:314 (-) Transcript_77387:73-1014(-)